MRTIASVVAGVLCAAAFCDKARGQVVALPTSETALLGRFARGPVDLPVLVGAAQFDSLFSSTNPALWPAEVQARQFFANGGSSLYVVRAPDTGSLAEALTGNATDLSGLRALEPLSNLRLLIAPQLTLVPAGSFAGALASFRTFLTPRRIFLVLDPPPGLAGPTDVVNWVNASIPTDASLCAIYYPYLDILLDGVPLTVPASGAMAAIYARNDAATGIWTSPAGSSLPLQAQALQPNLSSTDSNLLNSYQIDAIRQFSGVGIVPWGARTLDRSSTDNLHISIVRTRSWIAASIERSLAFAAVEDNAPPLWTRIASQVETFLYSLFRQGALVGTTPSQAYFVRCDSTTTTAADIAAHRVNVIYGLALVRAGEFDITTLTAATYDSLLAPPVPAVRVRSMAGNLLLAYPTVAGFNYLLESRQDLQSASWDSYGFPSTGDGAWRTPAIPIHPDRGFYRLRITPAR